MALTLIMLLLLLLLMLMLMLHQTPACCSHNGECYSKRNQQHLFFPFLLIHLPSVAAEHKPCHAVHC
jgi:hypothetical protein